MGTGAGEGSWHGFGFRALGLYGFRGLGFRVLGLRVEGFGV